jgi:hypothetical protein
MDRNVVKCTDLRGETWGEVHAMFDLCDDHGGMIRPNLYGAHAELALRHRAFDRAF